MKNSIKIVNNLNDGHISYYFLNEKNNWVLLKRESPLTRVYFANSSIYEHASDIVKAIDDIYNRSGEGVEIVFEGTIEDYNKLKSIIFLKEYVDKNISCKYSQFRIIVAGKVASGKSTLIESIYELCKYEYEVEKCENYDKYYDKDNKLIIYKLKGISFENSTLENIELILKEIASDNEEQVDSIVYCVESVVGRLENIEINLINDICESIENITMSIALTNCRRDNYRGVADEIKKELKVLNVYPVLAKDYVIGNANETQDDSNVQKIPAFGVDKLYKGIIEGNSEEY